MGFLLEAEHQARRWTLSYAAPRFPLSREHLRGERLSDAVIDEGGPGGTSLSDFLLGELTRMAARPSRAELLARIAARDRVELPPAESVLAEQRPAT